MDNKVNRKISHNITIVSISHVLQCPHKNSCGSLSINKIPDTETVDAFYGKGYQTNT